MGTDHQCRKNCRHGSLHQAKSSNHFYHYLSGSEIKQVRVQKHLGLNIDERTWTDHVSTIVNKKTSSRLGLLRRLRPCVLPLVIQTLFRTCVLPVLEYASLACSGLGTINAERLERLQRTAACLSTGTRLVENVPRKILLARAGLDKLADCRKIKCGIFAFKLAFRKNSNCLPRHVLEAAETWLSLAPDRNLRHELSFAVPYGCHPPTSASNQHYEILPFLFLFLCFKLCAPG